MEQQSGQQPAVLSNKLSGVGYHRIPDRRVSPVVSVFLVNVKMHAQYGI